MGGEAGPPIEVQYLGETARIRVELTKYDPAQAVKMEARIKDATAGTPAKPGTLVFTNSKHFSVAIKTTNPTTLAVVTRTYPRCIPRHGIELNRGSKFSTFVVEFEAHRNNDLTTSSEDGVNGSLWTEVGGP